MAIRLLLVDDHLVVLEALRDMLNRQSDMTVEALARNGEEGARLAVATNPDVVVMDVTMPGLNGIEATRRILHDCPSTRILALSMHAEKSFVIEMLRAGSSGFLVKQCSADEMFGAIRAVAKGQMYLSPAVASYLVDVSRNPLDTGGSPVYSLLSSREREVLQLLAEGVSTRQIASRLNLSISTIETHRRQLKTKLKLNNTVDIVKFALREGLTSL